MTQTLNVTVPIPDTHVLVAKDEYNELLSYSLDPVWDLKELKRKLKMSSDDTIKDRLLFNPKFEKLLKQQGIAHYPDGSLNRWRFNARKMNKFIEEHFEEIHGKGWSNENQRQNNHNCRNDVQRNIFLSNDAKHLHHKRNSDCNGCINSNVFILWQTVLRTKKDWKSLQRLTVKHLTKISS